MAYPIAPSGLVDQENLDAVQTYAERCIEDCGAENLVTAGGPDYLWAALIRKGPALDAPGPEGNLRRWLEANEKRVKQMWAGMLGMM
jgi:hypothetical protein